jgi:phosphomannomutase
MLKFYGKRFSWLEEQKNKRKKQLILFDMDGTLTESRKEFKINLLDTLKELSRHAEIGIVSGSDTEYIYQQMGLVLNKSELRYRVHILPCNGTKHFIPPASAEEQHHEIYSVDMKEKLGENKFNQLMACIIKQQASGKLSHFPLTGHFVQYRGSMINWCPVGRNALDGERKKFVDFDKSMTPTYRSQMLDLLKSKVKNLKIDVTVKYGGDTSFDIYPTGWDKTYCLKHFHNYTCWFVGDRCDEGGNDKEIFDLLLKAGRAFKTEDPDKTKLIINESIIPKLSP